MRVIEFSDPKPYRDRVFPLLLACECENCVPIGLIARMIEGRPVTRSTEPTVPLLLAIEDGGGRVVAAAMQTPPHPMLVSPMDQGCAAALVGHLHERGYSGREFTGTVPAVRFVARAWQARAGGTEPRVHIRMKQYRTDRVIDPPRAPGTLRVASSDQLEVAAEMMAAFGRDVDLPLENPSRAAQYAIEERRLHFWIDRDEPRACCAWQGPTPNSVRIGLVYTPPAHRGQGYASNAVAELTCRLLASGKKYCTLFTDAANPTSNGIYQKIGYEFVAEFEHLKVS